MPHGDYDSLIFLFETLKGDFWYDSTNWESGEPLRKWHGISVNVCGRISIINLKENRLQGKLVESDRWKSLNHVEFLCFSGNRLDGSIPLSIQYLTSLTELDLSWNGLTGSIPKEIFTHLLKLQIIKLDHNKLSGEISPAVSRLKCLQLINCSYNQLTGMVPYCLLQQMTLEDRYRYLQQQKRATSSAAEGRRIRGSYRLRTPPAGFMEAIAKKTNASKFGLKHEKIVEKLYSDEEEEEEEREEEWEEEEEEGEEREEEWEEEEGEEEEGSLGSNSLGRGQDCGDRRRSDSTSTSTAGDGRRMDDPLSPDPGTDLDLEHHHLLPSLRVVELKYNMFSGHV